MRAQSKIAFKAEWAWWLAFLLALAVAPRVFGEETAPTTPREVTVFPDSARVTRVGTLELTAGSHQVVFPDLPASVVDSSLRLTVDGPQGTKLYGVSLRSDYTSDVVEKRTRRLKDRLQDLEDQKTDLNDKIEARRTEMDLLKGLAKESTKTAVSEGPTHSATIQDFTNTADAVEKRIGTLLAENRLDERSARSVESKIQALKKEMGQTGSPEREKRVAEADIELPKAGKTVFTLVYQVSGASWTPLYDLRLSTDGKKPRMDLAFNAGVQQKTGEDWTNVSLTLSTSRPTQGTQVPDEGNWWLDYLTTQAASYNYNGGLLERFKDKKLSVAQAKSEAGYVDLANAPEAPAPAEVVTAQTIQAPYAMSFSIPVRRDIPSDGTDHRVAIAQNAQPVALDLVVVPRLSQAAFLQAHITYGGEQTLLPGSAQLFRDGDFVGTTYLAAKAPGEGFDLGFGQDDSIRVERKLMRTLAGGSGGIFDFHKGEHRYTWVTTVANYHPGTRTIEVREQLPRSRQKDITVEETEVTPKPRAEDPERPGLVSWKIALAPREKTKLTFGYQVKYPDNVQVTGLE